MLIIPWATEQAATLLRVEGGVSGLHWELRWTVEDSISSRSFYTPAYLRFSSGLALALAGHRPDACRLLERVDEIVRAGLVHAGDTGMCGQALLASDLYTLLYCCEWILHGGRRVELLAEASSHMVQAERRATLEGLPFGESGHELMALLQLLQGNAAAALDFVQKANLGMDISCRYQTLMLSANYLMNPERSPAHRDELSTAFVGMMQEEFAKNPPDALHVVLWLDLLNVCTGAETDPWALLDQLTKMLIQH